MADARELPLWYNHVWLGYLNVKKCRSKQAPFIFDLNHAPIYVDDFCRQTGLKRTTWRQSIHVEKTDGDIVPALPLITPPNILHSPVRQGGGAQQPHHGEHAQHHQQQLKRHHRHAQRQ